MNITKKILITLTAYVLSLVCLYFTTEIYTDKKETKLRLELISTFNEIFNNGEVFVVPSNFTEKYTEHKLIEIPQQPSLKLRDQWSFLDTESQRKKNISKHKKDINEWKKEYGDLTHLYKLSVNNALDSLYPFTRKGWSLMEYRYVDFLSFTVSYIYPDEVGVRNVFYGNYECDSYDHVTNALTYAYNYYTEDPESKYHSNLRSSENIPVFGYTPYLENDYFKIETDRFEDKFPKERVDDFTDNAGWVSNSRYRIFIRRTYPIYTHRCVMDYMAKQAEKELILIIGGVVLSLLASLIIMFVTISYRKTAIMLHEALYDKLLRLCNPTQFMKSYNKGLIDKANNLYSKLLNTDPGDEIALKDIRNLASSELNINFVNSQELKIYKKKANPENFISPYNAEKISLANECYNTLCLDKLTVDEFEEIKQKINDKLV